MKKWLLAAVITLLITPLYGQTAYNEIHNNHLKSASNYMAYPGPVQQELTPAPRGYKPFYLSHYGRHGSRYHSKPSTYNAPYLTLLKADSLGKLTTIGKDIMRRLDVIRHDAENHWGDLTELGARQQQDIARRMFERFPELFQGHTEVDARSTGVGRCVLSMEYAMVELLRLNPQLTVHLNATHRDMSYLNLQDKELFDLRKTQKAKQAFMDFRDKNNDFSHLMRTLFNDSSYVREHIRPFDFAEQLILVAAIMQNVELGKKITLYDVFTPDEAYRIWEVGNAYWYIGWGASPATDGKMPYVQRNLLRKIIEQADSCIQHPHPGATLRFGHDTSLLPLVCLMGVNGYDQSIEDLEKVDKKGWLDYEVFPMASNLQLVFYRKSADDPDVLLKVLLNEDEATLPLPDDLAPYYRWSDFRDYYLKKLDSYIEQ
jgi:hypothetical protein